MRKFINEQMKEVRIEHMPSTIDLLINYIKREYKDNADLSEDSLKKEWNYLKDNNMLELLFISEWIYSESRWNNVNL